MLKDFFDQHEKQLDGLNDTQKKAVAKSFAAKDYQMIIGVPGSGKNEVIIRYIQIAKKLKQKVLLINYNNQTCDNILHRIIEN